MAITSKIQLGEGEVMQTQKEIKHVVRAINRHNLPGDDGSMPALSVEQYLKTEYFDQGWSLYHVQAIEFGPDMIQMLYVLVR